MSVDKFLVVQVLHAQIGVYKMCIRDSNNKGDISPLTAAEIAKSFGIRVYTIGVGTNGLAPYPYPVGGTVQYVNMPVEIDEKMCIRDRDETYKLIEQFREEVPGIHLRTTPVSYTHLAQPDRMHSNKPSSSLWQRRLRQWLLQSWTEQPRVA